ncbi:hypothetical protein GUITHDRAFT_159843 [Guillardia theta CCMP2712]|uniref:Arp2/3 complex 41 kDa subunit n=1 Tax=Guillardia theta (strain CCMP2712) TaxID=905079 RepID=L1J326_GUITC|nr:hypothetical protein GUITHDRAFT_159843 [Guillardia theta CCMP2712]EKX42539.1 hypothetical protein GUITHDRAFT_159843 [Guillardia theta CCMP2712]|eukprot:XP_005829519.1 hypothetical protein GUITHDRAFT_159843 [Guillardia theta CCMP2712]
MAFQASRALFEQRKRPCALSCIAVSHDGRFFAYCPQTSKVLVSEYKDGEFRLVKELAQHDQLVTSIEFAPSSYNLLTCSQDRNAYVWDFGKDNEWNPTLVHLRIHRAATYCKWSWDGKKFAVCSGQKCISVCYYEEENNWWVSKLIEDFDSTVSCVCWHKSNTYLAAGSMDGAVRLFTAAVKGVDDKPTQLFGPDVSFKKIGQMICKIETNSWVHDICFSPTFDSIAFVTHDSSISFLPIQEGVIPQQEQLERIRCSGLPHLRMMFLSHNRVLAAGHDCNPTVYAKEGKGWKTKNVQSKISPVSPPSAMKKRNQLRNLLLQKSVEDSLHYKQIKAKVEESKVAEGFIEDAKFAVQDVDPEVCHFAMTTL